MHLPLDDIRYSPSASSNGNYFLFCGWCEVWFMYNKNKTANATHGLSLVQKMFRDWTDMMLDWRGPCPGSGPVLTLLSELFCALLCMCMTVVHSDEHVHVSSSHKWTVACWFSCRFLCMHSCMFSELWWVCCSFFLFICVYVYFLMVLLSVTIQLIAW